MSDTPAAKEHLAGIVRHRRLQPPTTLPALPGTWARRRSSGTAGQLVLEPSADEAPVPLDRAHRQPERLRRLLDREAGEVTQLHDAALARVLALELGQGLLHREDVGARVRTRRVRGDLDLLELDPFDSPTALQPRAAPRLLDQDAPHGLRGGA